MSRTVGVDPETGEWVVTFRFDRRLKDYVKALPGSRFHWSSKTWRFPAESGTMLFDALQDRGFAFLGEAAATLGTATTPTLGDPRGDDDHGGSTSDRFDASPAERGPAGGPGPDLGAASGGLTVGRLNALLAGALAERFPEPVWVTGTLSGYSRGAHRAHVWFELVEEDDDGRSRAAISAVLFASARERVERRMRRVHLELADDLPVRLLVRPEIYARRGALQLIVEDIDPAWSAGDLALRREELLRELRGRRLVDRQRTMPMPTLPRRIAVVTSHGSDAWHDVMSSLLGAGFGFEIVPFDVRVQGEGLADTVCAAMERIADDGGYDLVVITRGGGSRVELAAWDDLRVALAVATSPVKVLVAIGHHQDQSVLDEIATSAKTPTEAGEWITGLWYAAEERLGELAKSLEARTRRRLAVETRTLELRARAIAAGARSTMARQRSAVEATLPRFVDAAVHARVRLARAALVRAEQRLTPHTLSRAAARRRDRLASLAERLDRAAGQRVRSEARAQRSRESRLRLAHPDNVLRRGFAIVQAAGEPLTSARALEPGASVTVSMKDGRFDADVVSVTTTSKPNEGDDT